MLTEAGIAAVGQVFRQWENREKLSQVITLEEAREADYNLSPSLFVDVGEAVTHRPLGEILADLQEARLVREQADQALDAVLTNLMRS